MSTAYVNSEQWKPVPGYEGRLEASNLGRIRSVTRVVPTSFGKSRTIVGKILSERPGTTGYHRIWPTGTGTQLVHRLVAMTWVPNPRNCPVINHIDGVKTNNHPSNLEWCTQKENMQHAHRIGLARGMDLRKGDLSIAAKLTEAKVAVIKRRLLNGERAIDLSKEYGVCKGTIGELKAGRSWGHVHAAPCE